MKNANCWGQLTWDQAQARIADLNRGIQKKGAQQCPGYPQDLSGDWRLPEIEELQSIVPHLHSGLPLDHLFVGLKLGFYWSATPSTEYTENAWDVNLGDGNIYQDFKSSAHHVWPVRGGR